ncbi:MAG: ATP-binding protein [Magnetococcus sp. DMHC-1]|nr:response regulator [Magnetococcales bacterium]
MNSDTDSLSILIIDDQAINIKVLNELLREEYRVYFATKGQNGLDIANERLPDLILLDVIMPEMDGHEVCRILKENPKTCKIPIIFITSLQVQDFEARGLQLGAVDYITKPFNADIVKLRIKNQLELKRHRDKLEEMVAEQTAQLRLAKENAEASDRAKSDLLLIFSHELRTPLNSILGFLDILEGSGLNSEQAGWLEIVKNSSNSLNELLDDILDLTRIDLGDGCNSSVPFDLQRLVDGVVHDLSVSARSKGLDLQIHADFSDIRNVFGQEKYLEKIIRHLLGNAIKFTEKGSIVLGIQKQEGSDEHNFVHFFVEDTGIGIDEGHAEFIFQYFTQVEQAITRKQGGIGLGLAYCKKIVAKLFDGRIWVESKPGKGSTFHFTARLLNATG